LSLSLYDSKRTLRSSFQSSYCHAETAETLKLIPMNTKFKHCHRMRFFKV
jgi:hypothetical protein